MVTYKDYSKIPNWEIPPEARYLDNEEDNFIHALKLHARAINVEVNPLNLGCVGISG